MLERSFIFSELTQERAPPVNCSINGNDYLMRGGGYSFADDTYPSWATFVKPISTPQDNKRRFVCY